MSNALTKASVSRSALWSQEKVILLVLFRPVRITIINSLLALGLGAMSRNSLYGH